MKTQASSASVSDYLKAFPAPTRKLLKQLRALIRKAAPGAVEKMSYGMPAYALNGVLAYFAGYERHIGLYAMPSAIRKFAKELAKYETSKGTVRFALDRPLPGSLITRIIKFRVKENATRKKKR